MPHGRYIQYESWWLDNYPSAHQPDTTAVILANVYRFEVAGLVLGARYFRDASDGGQHRAWIVRPGDPNPVAIAAFHPRAVAAGGPDSWQHAYWSKSVKVAAGDIAIVCVHFSDGNFYYDAGAVLIGDVTHGNVTAVQDTEAHHNGQFTYHPDLRLSDTFGATLYGVDVLFQAREW